MSRRDPRSRKKSSQHACHTAHPSGAGTGSGSRWCVCVCMCVCGCVCVCWCVYVQVLYTSVCMCMMCMNVWGDKNETHYPFPPPSIPFTSPSSSLPPSWSCITLFLSFLNLLLLPSHFLALSFPLSVHVSIRSSLNHSLYSSFLDSPSRRYTHSHNQCQWVASVYSVHDFFDLRSLIFNHNICIIY